MEYETRRKVGTSGINGEQRNGKYKGKIQHNRPVYSSEFFQICLMVERKQITKLPNLAFNVHMGSPCWLSGKNSTCQGRELRVDPWVRKIPWRRKQQPTEIFLLGKSNGQRSLAGYSPWVRKRVRHDLATKQQHMQYIR